MDSGVFIRAYFSAQLGYTFAELRKELIMSAITMNVSEFATKVEEVIANLKRDEELILTGDQNQVVAKLIPANEPAVADAKPKRRQLGLSDSIIWISPDFDEPLEEYPLQ
jgi:hypothetical protein